MESTAAYFVDHEGRKIPVPWARLYRASMSAPIYADHFRFFGPSPNEHKSDHTLPIILHFTSGALAIRKALIRTWTFWADILMLTKGNGTRSTMRAAAICRWTTRPWPRCQRKVSDMVKARGDDPRYLLNDMYPES